MAVKTLNLIVTSKFADATALRAAAAIALREDAHLEVICLGVEPMPLEAMSIGGTASILLESGRAEALEQAQALAAWAEEQLPLGLRASVEPRTVIELGVADVAAGHGRFADLVVLSRPYRPGRDNFTPAVAEGLLLGTGAPVLVVPDTATDWSEPFRRICLAWDDSAGALRAARAALPFLKAAEQVDIAVVDPPLRAHGRAEAGSALSVWLSRHGVKASVALLARTEPRVADILERFAQEQGAEAIVMGAYGHSRLREAVLGGVTRDMLAAVPLPLMMAH